MFAVVLLSMQIVGIGKNIIPPYALVYQGIYWIYVNIGHVKCQYIVQNLLEINVL